MSDEIEEVVQQNSYLIQEYLIGMASKQFKAPVSEFQMTATQTTQKIGATGQVLISTIFFDTEYGSGQTNIALKFFQNEQNAMDELKNSLELDVRFKTHPHFATPKVIFASTKDPVMIIYEGLNAINYDEIDHPDKASHAGKLLAAIHHGGSRPVDTDIYKGLARMIGNYIAPTGLEKDISRGLGLNYSRLEGAMSGCNPFSDFHQSNVMLSITDDFVNKVYVIDPEFMQKGSFDRLEDVGTFFGAQLLREYVTTGGINTSLVDIQVFLKSYEELNIFNLGLPLKKMYPSGNPLGFFIAQWAIMDAIDQSMRMKVPMTAPQIMQQLKFVKYIFETDPFSFPE